jgi:hypothetical protein
MLGAGRIAATLLLLAVSTGHAAGQPLENVSPAAIQQRVQPGDEVRIVVRDGRSYELEVTRVEEESLTGTAESGKNYKIRYSAIERIEIALVAEVEAPAPSDRRGGAWLGLSAGVMAGGVKVPCSPSRCSETGFFSTYGVSLTVAGDTALRLRAVRANEDTEHKPFELAVLAGPRVTRSMYFLLGFGSIRNPDDEYLGDTANGLAWEFLIAESTPRNVSVEFSFHGNHFGDAQYGGLSIGARFGNLR